MYFTPTVVFAYIDEWKIVRKIKYCNELSFEKYYAISRGMNYRSKIRDELSCTVNYCLKTRTKRSNRSRENAGKFPQNIVSSEISSKSQEKPGISQKFACITLAQYCSKKVT